MKTLDKHTLKTVEGWLRESGINIPDVLQRIQDEVKAIDIKEFSKINKGVQEKTKPNRGDLTWTFCGKTEIIHKDKPFKFLQFEMVRLKKSSQFNKGEFEIKYTKQ